MKNRVEYCNTYPSYNIWREWVKQLAVCEFMHRKLTSPNYMSTSVRLPVCLHCSHVKYSTVKRFKTLRGKMLHPVYSRPYRCLWFHLHLFLQFYKFSLLRPCFSFTVLNPFQISIFLNILWLKVTTLDSYPT